MWYFFKEAVINSSVTRIIYVVGEITFKVAVMTSLVTKFSLFVAKITFVIAEITFNMAVMTSSVAKISSFVAKVTFVAAHIIFKVASVVDISLVGTKITSVVAGIIIKGGCDIFFMWLRSLL